MNYISFPGLGIESFALNRVAFSIGGFDIMWYGIIITCGMLLAYLYGLTRAKLERVKSDDVTDLTLFLILFGIIGARLYYVLFKLEDFVVTDANGFNFVETLKKAVNLRSGGLAIYGGVIAGFITILIVARVKRIKFPVLLDIVAPCAMIGQLIGRWGNFFNVEAYGSTTDLPWRMGVGFGGGAPYVHPTFLYESLWNLLGLIIITALYKKKKFHGQIFLEYIIWYGVGRAFIEGLRTDSLMLGDFRVSQILSIALVAVGVIVLAVCLARAPRIPKGYYDKSTLTIKKSDIAEAVAESASIAEEVNAEAQKTASDAKETVENVSESVGSAAEIINREAEDIADIADDIEDIVPDKEEN